MKLWVLLQNHYDNAFACYLAIGTWSDGSLCKTCGEHRSNLIEPHHVEWEVGSDVIGDAAWCSYDFIVVDRLRNILVGRGFECDFGRVGMMPPDPTRKRNIVPWPYDGPTFHWAMAKEMVPLN